MKLKPKHKAAIRNVIEALYHHEITPLAAMRRTCAITATIVDDLPLPIVRERAYIIPGLSGGCTWGAQLPQLQTPNSSNDGRNQYE